MAEINEPALRLYDIGTAIKLIITDENDAIVDISSATVKKIIFRKPGGTTVIKTVALYTDGTDGIVSYVTALGDIDTVGEWKAEAYVELGSGKWYTTIDAFDVGNVLAVAT